MTGDAEFAVMTERFDGLAWGFMLLIADLEKRELLDGTRFCGALRRKAGQRRTAGGLEISALTMEQLADRIDAARDTRKTMDRKG